MTWTALDLTIYHTLGKHAYYYTNDAVWSETYLINQNEEI